MREYSGSVFLADCPARLAIEIIADKWAVVVLFALSRKPCRHGELVDLIGGISRKVLTQTLRRLQGYGLVDRHAEAGRIEYVLTDLGRTLVKPIAVLTEWAHEHGAAVVEFRESETDEVVSGVPGDC
ncbi:MULTISPECIES: helix-turn-helix domain-containing protein [unclassified Streptomyces]|uniref:winged helix-turn-helix transcriptional regulator n=1 Tax=unclassified Streptomyces TaxID=2593676 RepID=UPI002E37C936|nr:helix-turn-helix domain-containing protein [Streptomyces sp. NBC_01431]